MGHRDDVEGAAKLDDGHRADDEGLRFVIALEHQLKVAAVSLPAQQLNHRSNLAGEVRTPR